MWQQFFLSTLNRKPPCLTLFQTQCRKTPRNQRPRPQNLLVMPYTKTSADTTTLCIRMDWNPGTTTCRKARQSRMLCVKAQQWTLLKMARTVIDCWRVCYVTDCGAWVYILSNVHLLSSSHRIGVIYASIMLSPPILWKSDKVGLLAECTYVTEVLNVWKSEQR